MTGQVPHPHPRKDQEARVVRQQRKVAFTRGAIPADKGVAAAGFPRRRTKQHTGQQPSRTVADQDFEVLPHATLMTQIMVVMQQVVEQPQAGVPGVEPLDSKWTQSAQIRIDRGRIVSHRLRHGESTPVGSSRAVAGRQPNLPEPFKLQQQRSGGHILQPPLAVAPVPPFAQLTRQSTTIPIRVVLQQPPDQPDVGRRDTTPLNDLSRIH